MAKTVYFQNAGADGYPVYDAKSFTGLMSHLVSDGIFITKADGAGLAVNFSTGYTKDDVRVMVKPGAVCASGAVCIIDTATELELGAVGGTELIKDIVIEFDSAEYTFALKAVDTATTEPLDTTVSTVKTFPLATVVVYPQSQSKNSDYILDLRPQTGYVDGILDTPKSYGTMLDTALSNYTTLKQSYQALAQQVEDTGTAVTMGIHTQAIAYDDLSHNDGWYFCTLTTPTNSAQILDTDLYLNGRLYTGQGIKVDRVQGMLIVNLSVSALDNIKIITFYART